MFQDSDNRTDRSIDEEYPAEWSESQVLAYEHMRRYWCMRDKSTAIAIASLAAAFVSIAAFGLDSLPVRVTVSLALAAIVITGALDYLSHRAWLRNCDVFGLDDEARKL